MSRNTNYTVTRNGSWWDVRRPSGQRVKTFPAREWDKAIAEADRLSAVDRAKHRHTKSPNWQPFRRRQSDYALVH